MSQTELPATLKPTEAKPLILNRAQRRRLYKRSRSRRKAEQHRLNAEIITKKALNEQK